MELAQFNIDTYKTIRLLQAKGFSEEQAEGVVEALQSIALSGVATKQDINDLRSELKQDINNLRHEFKNEFKENLKFQLLQTITIIGVVVALFTLS